MFFSSWAIARTDYAPDEQKFPARKAPVLPADQKLTRGLNSRVAVLKAPALPRGFL